MFVTTLFSCELPRSPYQHLDSKTMHIALRETYWRRPWPCNSFDYLSFVNLLVAAFDVEMFYYFFFALIKCVRNKSNWNSSLWHSYLFFRKTVQFQFCSVEISFFWIWTKRTCNIAWIHFLLTHLIILFMSKGISLDVLFFVQAQAKVSSDIRMSSMCMIVFFSSLWNLYSMDFVSVARYFFFVTSILDFFSLRVKEEKLFLYSLLPRKTLPSCTCYSLWFILHMGLPQKTSFFSSEPV